MTDEANKPIDEMQGALERSAVGPVDEGPGTLPSSDALDEAGAPGSPVLEDQTAESAVEEQEQAAEVPVETGDANAATKAEAPAEIDASVPPVEATQLETSDKADEPEPVAQAEPTEPPAGEAEEPATEPGSDAAEADEPEKKDWYILKVQSNREDSIREGLLRRVAIAGLGDFFGDVIVPTEKITEVKGGKKRVMKRKLYPGYLVVQMEINEDTWFLVRETPGIGDFTGAAGTPTPMLPHEVTRILARQEEKLDETPKLKIAFSAGDRIKINEGTFENFEGEVDNIDEHSGRVTVMINIFGRSTPVELEYWQIESL